MVYSPLTLELEGLILPITDPHGHRVVFVHTFRTFTPDEHKETVSVSHIAHIQKFYLERKACGWLFHLNSKYTCIVIMFDEQSYFFVSSYQ